jgi:hypothetical protein
MIAATLFYGRSFEGPTVAVREISPRRLFLWIWIPSVIIMTALIVEALVFEFLDSFALVLTGGWRRLQAGRPGWSRG